MLWKQRVVVEEEGQQSRQMREVAGNQDVTRFAAKPVAHTRRRIARLKIGRRGEFREGIAGAPERLRRLPRAKLAAVPDDGRARPTGSCVRCGTIGLRYANRRERTSSVDLGADGVGVVNEEQLQV